MPRLSKAICKASPSEIEPSTLRSPVLSSTSYPTSGGLCLNWRRVVRPGGTVAVYLWDYAGEMQFMRYFWDAADGARS